MREALAEYFRVLSFTTVDADRNHFQSFVLEKPGRRFHNRRPLTLGVAKRHQQRRIADKDVDGEAHSRSHRATAGHRSNPATR